MVALTPPASRTTALGLKAFAGADVHQRRIRRQRTLEQQFHASAAVLHSESPRGNDAGVVEHQNVPRLEQGGKLAKTPVFDRSAAAVERQ